MRHLLLPLLLVAGAAPAVAQSSETGAPGQGQQEDRICRSNTRATGSIMPSRRVCKTAAEWREIDDQNRRNAEQFRNSTPQPRN